MKGVDGCYTGCMYCRLSIIGGQVDAMIDQLAEEKRKAEELTLEKVLTGACFLLFSLSYR